MTEKKEVKEPSTIDVNKERNEKILQLQEDCKFLDQSRNQAIRQFRLLQLSFIGMARGITLFEQTELDRKDLEQYEKRKRRGMTLWNEKI